MPGVTASPDVMTALRQTIQGKMYGCMYLDEYCRHCDGVETGSLQ